MTAWSLGPRLLPTTMVILFIRKNSDRLILTVVGQIFHGEFAKLRKTRECIFAAFKRLFISVNRPDKDTERGDRKMSKLR
jgi:hypothetical protein